MRLENLLAGASLIGSFMLPIQAQAQTLPDYTVLDMVGYYEEIFDVDIHVPDKYFHGSMQMLLHGRRKIKGALLDQGIPEDHIMDVLGSQGVYKNSTYQEKTFLEFPTSGHIYLNVDEITLWGRTMECAGVDDMVNHIFNQTLLHEIGHSRGEEHTDEDRHVMSYGFYCPTSEEPFGYSTYSLKETKLLQHANMLYDPLVDY